MTLRSTDDPSRMLQFRWMGPASAPLGFEVRFPILGLFIGVTVILWAAVGLLGHSGMFTFKIGFLLVLAAPGLAILAVRRISPYLTPDKPLAYYVQMAKDEWRTPRPPRRRNR